MGGRNGFSALFDLCKRRASIPCWATASGVIGAAARAVWQAVQRVQPPARFGRRCKVCSHPRSLAGNTKDAAARAVWQTVQSMQPSAQFGRRCKVCSRPRGLAGNAKCTYILIFFEY